MSEALLLDEAVYDRLSEVKKPVYVFDWLRGLDKSLSQENKKNIREVQDDLVQQLLSQLSRFSSPPTHRLIGRCLSKLFLVGDTLLLYTAVNTCNSLLKSRDDGASTTNGRLAAMTCLGTIYRNLGRMIGRTFEDSVTVMVKLIKQSESQVRSETMNTLRSLLEGVGQAASMCTKEIYKAAKSCLTDRVLSVRVAAAKCLYMLVDIYPPMYQNELEATVSLCFRCMDGSNYAVRLEASKLLGYVMAKSQQQIASIGSGISLSATTTATATPSKIKVVALKDALGLLASGFLRGPGGFLKGTSASDMIKGTNSVNREVRLGVTYAYIEFVTQMGALWFEANLTTILTHCISLSSNPRAVPTHVEAIHARNCINYILCTLYRTLLSEAVQLVATRELVSLIRQHVHLVDGVPPPPPQGADAFMDLADSTTDIGTKTDEPEVGEEIDGANGTDAASRATGAISVNSTGRRGFGRASRAQREHQQQHLLVCSLDQLTQLIRWLDSMCVPLLDSPSLLPDILCTAFTHPQTAVRLSAASCLRQLIIALPSQRASLLQRCISGLQHAQRSNSDALAGYSAAISGILAGASLGTLGIPSGLAKQVFSLAEELLRAANQNSRLTLARTQAGWQLLAAYMCLGPDMVRPHLPRLLLFWRNAFPRSMRELEAEKQRGDAFTWQVMLEARAGALCSIQAFLEYCSPILITEEAVGRLLAPIECALNMLAHLLDIVRIYGNHLKATASLIRHRLYRILLLLPHTAYTSSYSTLLRELVAEFTLTDNAANTTTSLLRHFCRSDESVTLNCWTQDTDQKVLEEQVSPQVQPNLNGVVGALEHDSAFLFLRDGLISTMVHAPCPSDDTVLGEEESSNLMSPMCSPSNSFYDASALQSSMSSCSPSSFSSAINNTGPSMSSVLVGQTGPPPISVAVIDSAVELFARLFPCVPVRHRVQMVDHFAECIRLTKSTRQEAVQINVFAALLGAMRRLTETKAAFGEDAELRKSTTALIMAALTSSNVQLRCTAGECLGRLAQVAAEPTFLSDLAQHLFDRLRSVRNPISRAGHCLAVGCLHRYVGGLASGQHLSTSVGVLLAIAQDSSVPEVQVWALHALALVADSGGPMFREFVEPSLNLVLQLLLRSPTAMHEIQRSLGRLLNALITTVGPELQGSSAPIVASRHACLLCCLIMQDSGDALLQAEAISCLQRLHIFVPQQVHLVGLAYELQDYLSSPHLLLRRATVAYLRQLSQKGTEELIGLLNPSELVLTPNSVSLLASPSKQMKDTSTHSPLDIQLFERLDIEVDMTTRRDLEETIVCMLQASAHSRLKQWLTTLKEVLQATTTGDTSSQRPTDTLRMAASNSATTNTAQSDTGSVHGSNEHPGVQFQTGDPMCEPNGDGHDGDDALDEGMDETLGGGGQAELNVPLTAKPRSRWPTRVFALGCLRLIMSSCGRLAQAAIASPQRDILIDASSELGASNRFQRPTTAEAVAHFDLALARCLRASSRRTTGQADHWLVLHLSDLIRVAFMSATSDSERLCVAGLRLLQDVIVRFGPVPDPEYPGHSILEQYQAQVSAALRPAFTRATASNTQNPTEQRPVNSTLPPSPELTATACLVCSTWLGAGVAREVSDLQRVYELLRRALDALQLDVKLVRPTSSTSNVPSDNSPLYCPDAIAMEQLAVLRAWADVYVHMMRYASHSRATDLKLDGRVDGRLLDDDGVELDEVEKEGDSEDGADSEEDLPMMNGTSVITADHSKETSSFGAQSAKSIRGRDRRNYRLLNSLLRPLLQCVSRAWLAVLQDYALINLPDELITQRPVNGGTFYGSESNLDRIRPCYTFHRPVFLLAMSYWARDELYCRGTAGATDVEKYTTMELGRQFDLLLGLCTEAYCEGNAKQSIQLVNTCLRATVHLLSRPIARALLMRGSDEVPLELLHVLYRLLLTRDDIDMHLLCLKTVNLVLLASEEKLARRRELWQSEESIDHHQKVLMAPEPTYKTSSMSSSILLQTTGLVDAELFELGEGGTLSTFAVKAVEKIAEPQTSQRTGPEAADAANPKPIGLQQGSSIVLTCLETIVCVLARYRSQLLPSQSVPELMNGNSGSDRTYRIPETRAAHSSNAPLVLAAAVACLIRLPDLCAPRVMLSSLKWIQPTEGNTTPCLDNVLYVLLDCLVRIAKTVLLQSSELIAPNEAPSATRLSNQTELPESYRWMASHALSLCGLSGDDVEISSTSTSARHLPDHERRSREQSERERINHTVWWSPAQAQLADNIVCLAVKLATHPYPTLTAPPTEEAGFLPQLANKQHQQPPLNALSKNGTLNNQPDSSSSNNGDATTEPVDGDLSRPVRDLSSSAPSVGVAASERWYELVADSLLSLLQHDHTETEKSLTLTRCCLASITLVSRIVSNCPLPVFMQSPILRHRLVSDISRAWRLTSLPIDTLNAFNDSPSTEKHQPDIGGLPGLGSGNPMAGIQQRSVCLAAINLLINQREPAVSAFFVRTLTPPVFRWLHDLSQSNLSTAVSGTCAPVLSKADLTDCLDSAIGLLECVVRLADTSNRSGLLLILIPSLCNLLRPTPPSNQAIAQWENTTTATSTVLVASEQLTCGLHVCALRHLIAIGPRYPTEFRSVFGALGELGRRLEQAIKGSATGLNSTSSHSMKQNQHPVIQLKTDFSDFAKR